MEPLISPENLMDELSPSDEMEGFVARKRREISDVIEGRDDRLILMVGPCSIHNGAEALEYAKSLHSVAKELEDQVVVLMRAYFEKPRTVLGWKGYISDPFLNGTCRIGEGLRLARKVLLELAGLGLGTCTEFLDPFTPSYFADLISYGAIGARTVESQVHRQLCSALGIPIGFKNGTDGNVQTAIDATRAARSGHRFIGLAPSGEVGVIESQGNAHGHIILRGGKHGPNYGAEAVDESCLLLRQAGLPESVVVDCSHANSGKEYLRQIEVARDLAGRIARGDSRIVGVMLESNLQPGRQDVIPGVPLKFGASVTDECLGWDQTEPLLWDLAAAVKSRRLATARSHESAQSVLQD
jgi:3-deoxy-7-phosphoheptulonate synthase